MIGIGTSRRVTNASPLVFLAKLGRLSLLQLGVQEVLVPAEVLSEVRAKPDAGAQELETHGFSAPLYPR